MRKFLLIIFVLSVISSAKAQSWCSPGSEWYFNDGGFGFSGYAKWNYLYDTLITGKNCNKIKENRIGYAAFPPSTYNYTRYIYTYVSNKVVYIKDVMQPGSNNFDTLYNFNAVIGSKWRMAPTSVAACAISFVTVLDTGRNTIQGQSLKWLKLNYTNNAGTYPNGSDTIYERFGALTIYPYWSHNVCPTQTDSEIGGPLRCFSDNQIVNYKHNWTGNCNYYYTSIQEFNNAKNVFKVFPNPANDILNLELITSGTNSHFVLTNILGKEILNVFEISGTNTQLNLKNLEKGIYFIQLFDQGKLIATQKIIKE